VCLCKIMMLTHELEEYSRFQEMIEEAFAANPQLLAAMGMSQLGDTVNQARARRKDSFARCHTQAPFSSSFPTLMPLAHGTVSTRSVRVRYSAQGQVERPEAVPVRKLSLRRARAWLTVSPSCDMPMAASSCGLAAKASSIISGSESTPPARASAS